MVRILDDDAVARALSLSELLPVAEAAFRRQAAGDVERPERPHFPVGVGRDPDDPDRAFGTGLTMPAYVRGERYYATKLASVHPANPDRGLPTVHAQIAVTEAETGRPAAYMAGERLTNARTACVGGLAARSFASTPATVGVLGAGRQARWQSRAIATAVSVEEVRIYSPSDSRTACAADLDDELDATAVAVDAPADAVAGADVVVTATTSPKPVFPASALDSGAVVVAVGSFGPEMQELEPGVFERAAHVFADVPEEVADVGDVAAAGVDLAHLRPFARAFDATVGGDETVVVESVGSATLDAAAAVHVFERARAEKLGTTVSL